MRGRSLVIKYGPVEPRKSLESRRPIVPKPKISCLGRELKKTLNDYLDFLAEVDKIASLVAVDSFDMDNFVSDMRANLRLLKTRFDALAKERDISDIVALYAVIPPRNQKSYKQ